MAREAYRSLYGNLKKLKDSSSLRDPATGTGDDDEMWQLLMSVSEYVDKYLDRRIAPYVTTKVFDGNGKVRLPVDDLLSVTTLKEDEGDDGTFEKTWTTSDYWLEPFNAEPTKQWGVPYRFIRARGAGDELVFPDREQNIQVVGLWGYREFVESSTTLINNGGGYDEVTTTLAVDSGTALEIGETIRIGSEYLLVTNIDTNDLTVSRGLNGSTAVSMLDNAEVDILRWPMPIERACLIQASRLWFRAPTFEPFYVDSAIDTDVRELLDPYVKPGA